MGWRPAKSAAGAGITPLHSLTASSCTLASVEYVSTSRTLPVDWAWIMAVISAVVGLAVALPLHWMGHFNYDWVSHLGAIYLGTIVYVVALIGLSQAAPVMASAGR